MIPTLMETAALAMLGGAVLLSLLRLLMGPTAPDRVVAADTLAVITTSGLVVLAALLGSALYLDVALIYGTLAFVGVVAIARAIEGNGS
ncbi:MAG: monovalent cation/H+ antiporter complex subunit F [Candidatus Thiodiazotropha sp.]